MSAKPSFLKKFFILCMLTFIFSLASVLVWLIAGHNTSNNGKPNSIQNEKIDFKTQATNNETIKKQDKKTSTQTHIAKAQTVNAQIENTAIETQEDSKEKPINIQTGLPFDKNNTALLQQRQEIMTEIASMANKSWTGEVPQKERVIELSEQLTQIYHQEYLGKTDALNTLSFLTTAYPSVADEIHIYIQEIENDK